MTSVTLTVQRRLSNNSDPESPVSSLLTSKRSNSKTFRRSFSHFNEAGVEHEIYKDSPYLKPPSIWRLAQLSSPEWLYALLGSIGVAVFGSFNPVLAYVLVQIAEAYSRTHEMLRNDVGWFDEEENNADSLSMRLANDATFVRATFSNRLSILIQDTSSVLVALVIGILLEWHLALAAFATLPF
eukprot:Gb_28449 [translate_table: standard]